MARSKNIPNATPRLVSVDVSKYNVKGYGLDNGYPNRMLNLYNASGSAKMCASLCAKYLVGDGFENLDFYSVKINEKGLTPDKLLRRLADDDSKMRGYYVHVNYNAAYQKVSATYLPFEDCRFGVGEKEGMIAVWKHWYKHPEAGKITIDTEPEFIHIYNPDPVVIEAQALEAGGFENYKGQIMWVSKDFSPYPLATIDPVLDDVQAEIESAVTRRGNLRNNFQMKGIWIEKGQKLTERQEQEVVDNIRDFIGPEGNTVQVVFSDDPDGKDVPEFKDFDNKLNDKLFQYTDQSARLAIYTQYGQPAVLHSDYLGASGFNEGQLPQSMDYYNSLTRPDRIHLEEFFRELFSNWHEQINKEDNYKITPLATIGNNIEIEAEDNRPLIEIIGVGGTQALQSILADTATTQEQKKNTLVVVFGITEENAKLLAGITEGEIKQ